MKIKKTYNGKKIKKLPFDLVPARKSHARDSTQNYYHSRYQ